MRTTANPLSNAPVEGAGNANGQGRLGSLLGRGRKQSTNADAMEEHASARIKGPEHRVCRDLLFLVTFLAFCVGMLVVGGRGFAEGDPKVLVYGFDYKGQLCDEGDLDGYTVTYWPNPQELARVVSTDINSVVSDPSLLSLSMKDVLHVCVKKCPQPSKENLWVCVYPNATFFSNTSDFGERRLLEGAHVVSLDPGEASQQTRRRRRRRRSAR